MKLKRKIIMAAIAISMAVAVGCSSEEPMSGNQNDPPSSTDMGTQNNLLGTEREGTQNNPGRPGFVPPNITAIDTTFRSTDDRQGVDINPAALSPESAAQIGAQYIWDVFGESIDGMFVEVSFDDWEFNTRSHWRGAVTINNRYTLEQREEWEVKMAELMAEIDARIYAGEDPDEVHQDVFGNIEHHEYVTALFYFTIDALTGKRIDIWQATPFRIFTEEESQILNEYMQNMDRDISGTMFNANLTPQEKVALSQMASDYAARHFNNTTVMNTSFTNASNNIDIDLEGNVVFLPGFASFDVTDSAGRVASISINLNLNKVTSISTIQNDMLPFEFDYFDASERLGDESYTSEGERTR